jgi:tetratricopeptide (TPR) repeat protein
MRQYVLLPMIVVLLVSALLISAVAQASRVPVMTPGGGSHKLFGDFKVDESKAQGSKPGLFQLVLYTLTGQVVARQSVSTNGRYFFHDIANGEYNLVIEMDGSEIERVPLLINERYSTDIRKDIALEWRGGPAAFNAKPGVMNVAGLYERKPANQNLFDKAQAAIKKNDNKQAASLLNQIVSADPKDFPAWAELGTVYFKLEKMGDAEKAFQHALNEKPGFIMALLNLGKLQFSQKNFEAAIETLTRAVESDPKSADAHFFLGESYLQVKKGSKAVGHLNEAIKLDPIGKAEAHLRLGTLYRAAGLKEKAVAEFEQFLSKRPDHPEKDKLKQYISENKSK